MQYYIYILRCSDDSFYTGITTDLKRRLEQHNGLRSGGAKYTRSHRPVALAYKEECVSRSEALKREQEIKKMSRAEKNNLIL